MNSARRAWLLTSLKLMIGFCCYTLFSGCSSMSSVRLNYTPGPGEPLAASQPVNVTVVDKRPFVLNGDEPPAFVGHVRGGYGNPWGYTTQGKIPLAKQMEVDLTKDLAALGFTVATPAAKRRLGVVITDFNFDGYMGGKFWYEIKVTVRDASDTVLAEQTIKDQHRISASMRGAHYSIREEVPGFYQQLVRKLVRENPKILQALKSSGK